MIAFGQLGLHPWELDEYTMTDFVLKWEGHRENEINEWRRIRFLGGLIVNTAGKYVKRKVKETDLIELPGEEKKKGRKKEPNIVDQIKQLQAYQNQAFKKVENK